MSDDYLVVGFSNQSITSVRCYNKSVADQIKEYCGAMQIVSVVFYDPRVRDKEELVPPGELR